MARGGGLKSDFRARFISALMLGPLVLFVAWLGGVTFVFLIAAIACLIFWEWTVMTLRAIDIRRDALALFCVLTLIGYTWLAGNPTAVFLAIGILVLAAFLLSKGFTPGRTLAGVGIAALFGTSLVFVREISSNGLALLLFLAFSVWAADVFAYLSGRLIGGPKLVPSISPNKTWAGFLGALVGGTLFGAGIARIFLVNGTDGQGITRFVFIALFLAFCAQIGDLLESAIKRRFNVKDTSNLIPGHGGMLDRVDGLIFASFVFVAIYAIGLAR
ncbi:MAG: CDP-archaeol synthase [Pseudomonadota bacterium]